MKDNTFVWSGWWSCINKNTSQKFLPLGSGKKGRKKAVVTKTGKTIFNFKSRSTLTVWNKLSLAD